MSDTGAGLDVLAARSSEQLKRVLAALQVQHMQVEHFQAIVKCVGCFGGVARSV